MMHYIDMKTFDEVYKLMQTFGRLDIDDITWYAKKDGEIEVFVGCNDVFAWGCADMETIEPGDIDLVGDIVSQLESIDTGLSSYWAILYISRKRKLRPQGIIYEGLPKQMIALLNDCGPEREIDICNPYDQDGNYMYVDDEQHAHRFG